MPRLLVIDDDLVQRSIICKIGAQVGYVATGVATFSDALQYLADGSYDCITLDLSLGEHHGIEVLKAVAEGTMRVPIVVISGCEERIQTLAVRVGQSLDLDMRGPIAKPLNLAVLRQTLSQALPVDAAPPPTAPVEVTAEELAHLLEADQIRISFQPRVDVATEAPAGCEALATLPHAGADDSARARLAALADTAGLAGRLAGLVLRRALAACAPLVERYSGFVVAVPVPAAWLFDPRLPEEIDAALAATGVPPSALVLEVSELAITDVSRVTDILVGLRIKGVRIAIAEFGRGALSLPALARMPIDELKLDRSLLAAAEGEEGAWRIVEAAIQLARLFKITPVADGVDGAAMLTRLSEAGCGLVQGRVFSRPLEAAALATWVDDQFVRCRACTRPLRAG
jgi:EAL domain-containing protein (putative c-di-GMP-specific phosphodiesterase class I)/CheY-like chemotaxis protein